MTTTDKCQADADTGAFSSSATPLQAKVCEPGDHAWVVKRAVATAYWYWECTFCGMKRTQNGEEMPLSQRQLEEASEELADDASQQLRSLPDTEILRSHLNEAVEIMSGFLLHFDPAYKPTKNELPQLLTDARAFIEKMDIG